MTHHSHGSIGKLAVAIEITELLRGHPQMHFLKGVVEDLLVPNRQQGWPAAPAAGHRLGRDRSA